MLVFDTSKVEDMSDLFNDGNFNRPLQHWNTAKVRSMNKMFYRTPFNQAINWDTSSLTDTSSMFEDSFKFNHPLMISTSKVVNMDKMFYVRPGYGHVSQFDQVIYFNFSGLSNG